ncbi:carbohydrate esterase family 1 protein [Delitschia confertaspora ATCC 74209]|uniref:feruloyl esterase n=1 Tax=Delitschia confertaspora ATCC 74209 TaxID=1513339 RepID=A0A9P4MXA2_9PLEO|nr:carbohydrate esterase family 1 protein [Delitschia confertaspora ATCC 74209]
MNALIYLLLLVSFYCNLILAFPQQKVTNVAPSKGCGKSHLLKGVTQYRTVESGGKNRSFGIHLPADYDHDHPYPVVLGFHGSSSIGLFFELDKKLSEPRFSEHKIMVYPNGVDGSWAGPSYHKGPVQEDLQFVTDLLSIIRSDFCINNNRIFATGFSNGGGFIGTIACSPVGGEFAALASGSGAFYTDVNGPDNGCAPARTPLPILEIHGGSDRTVNYTGGQGEGGLEPPINMWLAYWAHRNGCIEESEETSFNGTVHHLSWYCQGVEALVQHYKVDDMGHAWASTEPNLSQIAALQGPTHIQASQIIMEFFDRFQKPT